MTGLLEQLREARKGHSELHKTTPISFVTTENKYNKAVGTYVANEIWNKYHKQTHKHTECYDHLVQTQIHYCGT
jgi:hypothetical protein